MTDQTIKNALAALEQQETAIQDEFEKLEARLSQVRAAKAALIALESDEPTEFDGKLADACRAVLKHAGKRSLTPTEVRDALKVLGYDLTKHNNPMASIHSVLKRLAETSDVGSKELRQVPGQRRYFWAANFAAAPPEALHIQDTINASMDAANTVIQTYQERINRMAHMVASSSVSAPPAVLIQGDQKKTKEEK